MSQSQHLKTMKDLNPTLKVVFKSPLILSERDAMLDENAEPKMMTMRDTDFFETEILRQFFINMSRVVKFQFAAYPEELTNENRKVALHYHAVVRSQNDKKFIKVAPRKYTAVLHAKCKEHFVDYRFPKKPTSENPFPMMFVEYLNDVFFEPDQSYEEYSLRHYSPDMRLITHKDFSIKPAFSKKTSSLSREVASRMRQREITAHAD